MSRLRILTRDGAPAASKPILDNIYRKLGIVPNLSRLIGSSPVALEAFAAFQDVLSRTLDSKTRARIALAVAQVNGSDYCLSAHSYLAINFTKLPPEEIALNRAGASKDPKADAAVKFAAKVVRKRGHIGDADLSAVRLAGYGDAQIVEIVALVAENVFTNYLNKVAETDIDFPIVRTEALSGRGE
ncbi:carboxymuconolactone decarboxylase family protein [Bradyrhizobium barranii subsp. barranii]|uniref:Carboxymuconolactone decarboxylase family protein n=1 Tax=Bradyrhizobium barranii subsp. barranii TaxID=2823807 RepID=A0A7Z0QK66_9BRAD|nr:carboxymuconolactone decarboxylase family protein [Bradyrhizobium barranii]UGX97966.1 carboxymuconolactone decarboxylase family protein [Bradyrhizobium barranii subsp. barranii]